MQKEQTVVAIALAGGQSSRMGQDKALIAIDGVPLLQKVCSLASECCSSVYVVTGWGDRYQALLPPNCHLIAEVSLPNETQSHGPLVGFAQGLAQVNADWVLLLACDLPRLQLDVIQNWIAALPATEAAVMALLCRGSKGWEPLCGFYRRSCLAGLNEYIDQGGRSFQGWLKTLKVQELPLADAEMLFNCNIPADLDHLMQG
jgi:molybdenum cofactor guanylyltransferase